ncbi:histone-lysine N-methyltransferase ash1 [Aspergillus pseudoustus]|uniref:Histone-lysine N-methyltransferase ash1 n=1 Tax=Aspergillus pseudoustus TaxID=1810923 RepID=A0ABR4K4S9_9EURO
MDRGFGLRSKRLFKPDELILEYTGEIITKDECLARILTTYKSDKCSYLLSIDKSLFIDATRRGSLARFVNHSCEPNCRVEKWIVGGKPRMALFAGDRGIRVMEELTFNYRFESFSQSNAEECRCRSASCRGLLRRN